MINAGDAPLASGKTYQAALYGIRKLGEGQSTLILEPTIAAGEEILGMIAKKGLSKGYAIPLRGRVKGLTCEERYEKRSCSTCPHSEKYGKPGTEARGNIASTLLSRIEGQVLNLDHLRLIGIDLDICPTMLMRVLSASPDPHITIAAHAYLSSSAPMDILEQVTRDSVIIDEADQLCETLLNNQQRRIALMKPRQSKTSLIRGVCNHTCEKCFPHFADNASLSGCAPYDGYISNPTGGDNFQHSLEYFEGIIQTVEEAVEKGIIKNIFNFESIRRFFNNIKERLPDYEPNQTTRKIIEKLKKSGESITDKVSAINIPACRASKFEIDIFDENYSFGKVHMRLAHLKKQVLTDPNIYKKEFKEIEGNLMGFLSIVDFLQYTPGEVSLVVEEEAAAKGGYPHCSLSLRYINQVHYERVYRFLEKNTRILSGTLLNARMVAANLLLPKSTIQYSEAPIFLHKSVLILLHNPQSVIEPRPAVIHSWELTNFYVKIQNKIPDLKLLHFATNTKNAKDFFENLCNDAGFLNQFKAELCESGSVRHDIRSTYEAEHIRPAVITIDKLRSSTSRAVNRNCFDICVVLGNGIANWDDRIMLYQQAKKFDQTLSLEDFVQYEQERAVIQALMRAPRSSKPTVCLYIGNLHSHAFPKFMQNRIVTTQEICRMYDVGEDLKSQFDAIVRIIQQFRLGEKIVIPKYKKKVEDSIIRQWDGRSDAVKGRLEHIEYCLAQKGYVDRVKDKKGERAEWCSFLDWLVETAYLKIEKRERKTVYIKVSG